MSECQECERLKAENARLTAVCALAYEKLGWIREHVEFKDSMNVAIIELGKVAESAVLSDLLAPTITLLTIVEAYLLGQGRIRDKRGIVGSQEVSQELARLRALAGESAPKKSSCAPTTEGLSKGA